MDGLGKLFVPNAIKSQYDRKAAVEDSHGKWYEESIYDPFNPQFDVDLHRKKVQEIMEDFVGDSLGGYAVAWDNIGAEVPYAEMEGHQTVGTAAKKPVKEVASTLTCTRPEKSSRAILSGVSGYAEPGEIILVQAPPGAGTTTFLNLLSGSSKLYNGVEGRVMYNGDNILDPKIGRLYEHQILRVRQEDVHYPQLMVRETLNFAAECGIPDYVPYAEVMRKHRVTIVSRLLGISHTMETQVGDEAIRGVSGGERKRVTIAEIVVGTMGQVVFCDNISKGLDAATTLDICRSIQSVARSLNLTIFCSLQQLGNEAFELFDKVCLLDSGRCLYYGPTREVGPYFSKLGFERPPLRSWADFLLSVSDPLISESVTKKESAGSAPRTVEEFVDVYETSSTYKDVRMSLSEGVIGPARAHSEASDLTKRLLGSDCMQPRTRQLGILLKRSVRLSWNKRSLIQEFVSKLMLSLLIGSLFFQLPLNSDGAYTRTGVIFMTCVVFALTAVQGVSKKFKTLPVFLKQREAHFYDASPYHLAGVLDSFILNCLTSFLFSTILYMMVGLNLTDSGTRYAYFFFMVITLATTMEMMSRVFTVAVSNANVAIILISIMTIAFIVYSGYLIPLPSSPAWFVWIAWISPVQYAFRALIYNEFAGLEFHCDDSEMVPHNPEVPLDDRVCQISSGDAYIANRFDYPQGVDWPLYSLLILWGLVLVMFTIVIVFARKQRYRGKKMIVHKSDKSAQGIELSPEDTQVGIRQAYFTWKNVGYSVPVGKREQKELLHDVSGYALPGRLCALMGASGAGKTTLMDVLARRKTKGTTEGEVKVNGYDQDDLFARISGYVEQMDIHISKTTVREAVEFSAKLRLPEEVSEAEREQLVERTIDLLELREIQHDLIGISGAAIAISSEQRKRLTIAVELVVRPSIIFLDEPTSGLDSRAALKVTQALRRVADTGVAVLCTIHQPSREVFSCFDSLLLLQRGGKTVYFGELGDDAAVMTEYFARNGAEMIRPEENPADYMLDQIGAGVQVKETDDQKDWYDIWTNSLECAELLSLVDTASNEEGRPAVVPEEAPEIKFHHRYATGFGVQLKANLVRFFRVYWRTPEYNFTRIASATFQSLLLGFSFFQVNNSVAGSNLLVAATFMSGLSAMLGINNSVPNVIEDRIAFYRESAAGAYSPTSYYIPLLLADMPFNLVSQTLFSIVFYFLVGFRPESFGYFYLLGLLYALWCNATGAMFGAISPNVEAGLLFVPLMNSVLNLMAGFTIPRASIPAWYIWIYWINPNAYYLVGNLKNVLTGLPIECTASEFVEFTRPDYYESCSDLPAPGEFYPVEGNSTLCQFCPVTSGDDILEDFTVPSYDKWVSAGALLAFIAISQLIGLIGFKYLRFLKR